MRKIVTGVVVFLLAGMGLYLGLSTGSEPGAASESGGTPAAKEKAPGFAFRTLEGDSASLADYRGRVVVLNFWGTWCPPCRREIPELVDLQERLPDGEATVVGIAVDSGTPEQIRSFTGQFGVNYPIWISGTRDVVDQFGVRGFPTTVIVDRDGSIHRTFLGPRHADQLMEDLRTVL